jgi:MinD superfamily P-loop ATPase
MSDMPIIDKDKCDGCGLCISVCKCGILALIDNKVDIIYKEECRTCTRWCAMCEAVCPNDAIKCPFEIVIEEKKDVA